MHEVEHRRRAGKLAQRRAVRRGRGLEVRRLDRHRVDLVGAQRRVIEQALAQVREIAVRIAGRRDALVHLQDVHASHGTSCSRARAA